MLGPVEKIKRDTVSSQVFTDLRDRILGGELDPGAKLPSEHALANSYGVSRSSVRAALQKLSVLGLVDIRVGEGSFVHERSFDHLMREVSAVVANESLTPYITEFRETIEAKATILAVERATDEELAAFVHRAEDLARVAEAGDAAAYVEADYGYHLALCKLSHNLLFEMVYGSIKDLFKLAIEENIALTMAEFPHALAASAKEHVSSAKALQRRDRDTAVANARSIVHAKELLTVLKGSSEQRKG